MCNNFCPQALDLGSDLQLLLPEIVQSAKLYGCFLFKEKKPSLIEFNGKCTWMKSWRLYLVGFFSFLKNLKQKWIGCWHVHQIIGHHFKEFKNTTLIKKKDEVHKKVNLLNSEV